MQKTMQQNEILVRKVIATIIGTLAFFIIGKFFKLNTGIYDVFIYLQFPVLILFSAVLGPISGVCIGLFGHLLVDLTGNTGVFLSWISGSAILGGVVGYFTQKIHINFRHYNRKKLLQFRLLLVFSQIIIWGIYAPLMNIIFYHIGAKQAFISAGYALVSNLLTSMIICDLLLRTGGKGILKRALALFAIVDTLMLFSYHNMSVAGFLVYIFTLIIAGYAFFESFINKATKDGAGRIIRLIVCIVGIVFLTVSTFVFVASTLNWPDGTEKTMVVLGGGLNGEEPSKILKSRLDKAYKYAIKHPNMTIIVSGGQGKDEVIPEAQAMKKYLTDKGIDENRIYMEDKSTTTKENFEFTYDLVKKLKLKDKQCIVYVTNGYHCFRSGRYAIEAGFTDAHPLPARTPIMSFLPNYFREFLALGKYALYKFGVDV